MGAVCYCGLGFHGWNRTAVNSSKRGALPASLKLIIGQDAGATEHYLNAAGVLAPSLTALYADGSHCRTNTVLGSSHKERATNHEPRRESPVWARFEGDRNFHLVPGLRARRYQCGLRVRAHVATALT